MTTQEQTSKQFEFSLRAAEVDPEGYYYPRWDRAEAITVEAASKKEAFATARQVLGRSPRGWGWGFRVRTIKPANRGDA